MFLPFVNAMQRFTSPQQNRSSDPSDNEEIEESVDSESSDQEDATADDEPSPYHPSLFEVLKTRYLLQWKVLKDGIPAEIVDLIIDAAEYWASVETRVVRNMVVRKDCDRELIRTEPLCKRTSEGKPLPHRTIHPCRKIVFSIAAHDQGWGNRGTEGKYFRSYTWFDAEIVPSTEPQATEGTSGPRDFGPNDPHLLPTGDKLQSNPTAMGTTQKYNITWHYLDDIVPGSVEAEEIQHSQGRGKATLDGRRVREMKLGDSISVWGRARFGGWSNHVDRLSVRVFWAV